MDKIKNIYIYIYIYIKHKISNLFKMNRYNIRVDKEPKSKVKKDHIDLSSLTNIPFYCTGIMEEMTKDLEIYYQIKSQETKLFSSIKFPSPPKEEILNLMDNCNQAS